MGGVVSLEGAGKRGKTKSSAGGGAMGGVVLLEGAGEREANSSAWGVYA